MFYCLHQSSITSEPTGLEGNNNDRLSKRIKLKEKMKMVDEKLVHRGDTQVNKYTGEYFHLPHVHVISVHPWRPLSA